MRRSHEESDVKCHPLSHFPTLTGFCRHKINRRVVVWSNNALSAPREQFVFLFWDVFYHLQRFTSHVQCEDKCFKNL